MLPSFPLIARRPLVLPGVTLALLTAAALGFWASRPGRAQAADDVKSGDHGVAEKVWVTGKEIHDRYPAAKHKEFMRKAIANSRTAGVEKRTGGAFGAVITDREGHVVGEGSNHVVSECDPTRHGEMEAIRDACKRLKALKLDGCVLYTSSEPCPMCLATAYWAGLDGIVFGAEVADSKKYGGFDDAFIYEQFSKPPGDRSISQTQLLQDEAVAVWKEYAKLPGNVPY